MRTKLELIKLFMLKPSDESKQHCYLFVAILQKTVMHSSRKPVKTLSFIENSVEFYNIIKCIKIS